MIGWGRKEKFGDVLARLPRATLRKLDRAGDRFDVPGGAVLLPSGPRVRWAWIVLAGELVVESATRVETVAAGRQWGAAQVLARDRRAYEVKARIPASVIAIPERALSGLLATDAAFGDWMLRRVVQDSLALREELALHQSLQVAA